MLQLMVKRICCCLLLLLFWSTNTHAQTAMDTVSNEVVEPLEESVTDTVVENESNAKEILRGKFNYVDSNKIIGLTNARANITDTIQQLKKKDDYWYADGIEEEKKVEAKKEDSTFWKWVAKILKSDFTKVLAWIIIIGTLLFIIVAFLRSNGIGFFSPASKKIKTNVEENESTDNIFEIDFNKAIANSIAAENYRLATRFLFLRILKELADKSIIEYAPDKTNFDYLFALSGTALHKDFSAAIYSYEYVWYGNIAITKQQFETIQQQLNKLYQQL